MTRLSPGTIVARVRFTACRYGRLRRTKKEEQDISTAIRRHDVHSSSAHAQYVDTPATYGRGRHLLLRSHAGRQSFIVKDSTYQPFHSASAQRPPRTIGGDGWAALVRLVGCS